MGEATKPILVKMRIAKSVFYEEHKERIEVAGVSSTVSRAVSNILVDQLNKTGIMDFTDKAITDIVTDSAVRTKLRNEMESNVAIDYLYTSSLAAAAGINVYETIYSAITGGRTTFLAAISNIANKVTNTTQNGSQLNKYVIGVTGEAIGSVAGVAAGLIALGASASAINAAVATIKTGASVEQAIGGVALPTNVTKDTVIKAAKAGASAFSSSTETSLNDKLVAAEAAAEISISASTLSVEKAAAAGVTASRKALDMNAILDNPVENTLVTVKENSTSSRGQRGLSRDPSFTGVVNVIVTLPYGGQYILSETVTFEDGSQVTSNDVAEIMVLNQPTGFLEEYKPPVEAYAAAMIIASKKEGNPKIINGLIQAIKKVSTSYSNKVLDQVAKSTGVKLGSSNLGNITIVSIENTDYYFVSGDKPSITIDKVPSGKKLVIPEDVTVTYNGNTIEMKIDPSSKKIVVHINGKAEIQTENNIPVTIPATNVRVTIDNRISTLGYILFSPSVNSFPALINGSYYAVNDILVYKRSSIELLAAGEPLPLSNHVSWAPDGLTAGSLMRYLGRTIVVADSHGTHLYYFRNIQWINGATTEGVSGSPADEDAWGTGWICTWADNGIPFNAS